MYLYVDATSVFVMHMDALNSLIRNTVVPLFVKNEKVFEFVLTLAMFWQIVKSLLHEMYLYVDITSVFLFMHMDALNSIL